MFQSNLVRFLGETDSGAINIHAIPILQVGKKPSFEKFRGEIDDGYEEISTPFNFTPQRLRLNKNHEIFEDGDIHRHLYLQDVATSMTDASETPRVSEFRCHIAGCSQLFDNLESYEHHYNSLHRHVCSKCKRAFPSCRLLDVHILEWHDSLFQILAEKQNMYQCLVEGCGLKFKTSLERKNHLIKIHSYPPDFRFDKSKKSRRPQGTSSVSMEISEDLGPQSSGSGTGESMELCASQESDGQESSGVNHRPKPSYSYKVPSTICFGQGLVRGFRGRRKKK